MKRFLRITGIVVVVVILAIPASFLIFKKKIRRQAEREISRYINGRVHFTDIGVSVLSDFPNLTVTLGNVTVRGRGVFRKDTLAHMKEFDCEIRTGSLLSGDALDIKSLVFHDLALNLHVLPDGQANYTSIIKEQDTTAVDSDSTASISLSLDRIAIDNGSVNYNDRSSDLQVTMKGLHYTGTGDFHQSIFDLETNAKIDEFSLLYDNVRYLYEKHVTASMVMEMNLNDNRFTLKDNTLQINHFKFTIDGSLTMLENAYDMDLKFRSRETSFHTIISLLPGIYMKDMEQIKTQGEVTLDGFVKGTYSDTSTPTFALNLNVRDASFKIDSLPSAVEKIACKLSIKNDYPVTDSTEIDVSTFHLDMMGYPIHGSFRMKNFSNPWMDMDIFANLDLAVLEKMYPISGIDMKGKLNAELKAKGRYVAFTPNVADSFALKQLPAFHLNLQLADGHFKYDHLPAPIDNIQLHLVADNPDGSLANTVLDLRTFHMDMGDDPIHGRIKISGYENYTVDADIQSKVDLAGLEKMYPITDVIMKGLLDTDITLKGTYNAKLKKFPMVDAHLKLADGYLKFASAPEPLTNVHLDLEAVNNSGKFADTRFEIQKLTYAMEEEPFTVKGSVVNLDNPEYDLKIKGRVDLEKITRIFPVPDWKLKGRIFSNFEAHGFVGDLEAGRYDKLKCTGLLKLKNFECAGPLLPQPILIREAHFAFTPEKIELKQLEGKFGKSNVSLTGELTDYMAFYTKKNDLITGDLDLKCDTLDLNEWYTPTTAATTTAEDSTTTVAVAWAVPANLNFRFDSDIERVNYQDLKISKLKGEITVEDGVLRLHETGFNSLDASFNLTGEYQTKDIGHPLFDFSLNIKDLDINKAYREVQLVRTLAPAAANTFGNLSIDYKLKGELLQDMTPKMETLVGGGEIRIANAKINGMKIIEEISKAAKKQDMNDPHLRDFVMDTEIHDNKIFVKPFSIKLSGLNTEIEGVSEMNGTIHYVLQIELLPIEKLKIPFHVTGTYDKPKVAIGKGHSLPAEQPVVSN